VDEDNTIVLGTLADHVYMPNYLVVGSNVNADKFTGVSANIQTITATTTITGNIKTGLGLAGMTQVCRDANNFLANCSSSLRYKTNIAPFTAGLSVVEKLKPIKFDWKEGGMHDLGFGAEDVAKVNELLVIHNDKGEVEGVKYDRISAVLVNAVKEQQAQIEAQEKKIDALAAELRTLRLSVAKRVRARRSRRK